MTETAEEIRLQALASLRILDTPREERFDRIVRLARRMFDVPTAVVSLIDEDRQFNKAESGLGLREIPRSQSFCDFAVRDNKTLVVDAPELDERFRDNPLVTGPSGIRFYAGEPLTTSAGVAVGALCITDDKPRSMTDDQLEILRELAALAEAELARGDELGRARDVQLSMLPRSEPDLPGYEIAGVCLPAGAVGGDFYDWFPVDQEWQVVVADVMGKGIPAALIGAGTRAMVRASSRLNVLETALNRVAIGAEADLAETASFVTMFAVRLDPVRHELTYVDAGHGLAGVVRTNGEVQQLRSGGLPLGAPVLEPYHAGRVQLDPGDVCVCVSDGLLDFFDSAAATRDAVRDAVLAADNAQDMVAGIARLTRGEQGADDLTVVVLRRSGA